MHPKDPQHYAHLVAPAAALLLGAAWFVAAFVNVAGATSFFLCGSPYLGFVLGYLIARHWPSSWHLRHNLSVVIPIAAAAVALLWINFGFRTNAGAISFFLCGGPYTGFLLGFFFGAIRKGGGGLRSKPNLSPTPTLPAPVIDEALAAMAQTDDLSDAELLNKVRMLPQPEAGSIADQLSGRLKSLRLRLAMAPHANKQQ